MKNLVLFALSVSALLVSIVNRSELDNLRDTVRLLHERLAYQESLQKNQPTSNQEPSSLTSCPAFLNEFYPGEDVTLPWFVFGEPAAGSRDRYNKMQAAASFYGSVLLEDKLVMTSPLSDILFNADGVMLSLRAILGLGPDLDTTPDPEEDGSPPPEDELPQWTRSLCSGPEPGAEGSGCSWRRDWGVDGCGGGVCACGGGWLMDSFSVRLRQLRVEGDEAHFMEVLAPLCCSPDATDDCADHVWLDSQIDCRGRSKDGSLCNLRDYETYRRLYLNQPLHDDAIKHDIRRRVNAQSWSASLDPNLGAGRTWKEIALPGNTWRDCAFPRLFYNGESGFEWNCNHASPLWFGEAGHRQYKLLLKEPSLVCVTDRYTLAENTTTGCMVFNFTEFREYGQLFDLDALGYSDDSGRMVTSERASEGVMVLLV